MSICISDKEHYLCFTHTLMCVKHGCVLNTAYLVLSPSPALRPEGCNQSKSKTKIIIMKPVLSSSCSNSTQYCGVNNADIFFS